MNCSYFRINFTRRAGGCRLVCTCVFAHVNKCIFECVCVCMFVFICVCIFMCVSVCLYRFVYMCLCFSLFLVYLHACVCVRVRVFVLVSPYVLNAVFWYVRFSASLYLSRSAEHTLLSLSLSSVRKLWDTERVEKQRNVIWPHTHSFISTSAITQTNLTVVHSAEVIWIQLWLY